MARSTPSLLFSSSICMPMLRVQPGARFRLVGYRQRKLEGLVLRQMRLQICQQPHGWRTCNPAPTTQGSLLHHQDRDSYWQGIERLQNVEVVEHFAHRQPDAGRVRFSQRGADAV